MSVLLRHRIRIAPDIKTHASFTDIITSAQPIIWRGTDVQIEVGLFNGGALLTDISDIASLYLEIHDSTRSGPPLVQKTILAANLTTNLTAEDWAGGTDAKTHALFTLAYLETQFSMAGFATTQQKQTFWLVIHAVTKDSPARRITWGGCEIQVEEDGAQNDLAVVPLSAPTFRISSGDLQLYNKTTGKYQPIWFEGPDGQEQLKWGAGQS